MKTFAVTSGKGGVGKTNLSANLAIALAQRELEVLVLDGDIGLANLDIILGVSAPYKLQHVVHGTKLLSEVITEGPGNIRFVGGGTGLESIVQMEGAIGDRFFSELASLEAETDFLIFDTGAGIDENALRFMSAADEVLLIVTPDPASLSDGYATAKSLLQRKPWAKISVIMNMVDDEAEAKAVYARLNSVAQQFIGRTLGFGGFVRMDTKVGAYVRQRKPFVLVNPYLEASRDVHDIAKRILGEPIIPQEATFAERLRILLGKSFARVA